MGTIIGHETTEGGRASQGGDALMDELVEREWAMFSTVNEGHEKVTCQERPQTFDQMRRAQFESWPTEALESYLHDLRDAEQEGRNLVTEKYLHMMRATEPESYERLGQVAPAPSPRASQLVDELTFAMVRDTDELAESYPYLSVFIRPATSAGDSSVDTSFETYTRGELMTYSERTLEALVRHQHELAAQGRSMTREAFQNTLRYQGFSSLDEAEEEARRQVQTLGGNEACPDCAE
ncbi:DUF4125 family protein [Olsenella sp. HMSC062G07]|uniref:DUF4125 family protein n=1 Tax=Olsenella sp. HMSC062G07 TaxID=1739330 RepID=UPI0008B59A79|nr:DUF4125 family protein [Olsenella sp. HMSC062G07]OFK23691.1 hypothetical protein HMPREF2826_04120 [Olsenella sp. HMSC062G07]